MHKQHHPFHLVNLSPWPATGAIGVMTFMAGMMEMIYLNKSTMCMLGTAILILTSIQWWRDVAREATFQGHHTTKVMTSMRMGMILFITSEVLFFLSFFWAFFHSSMAPSMNIGIMWPPLGVTPLAPLEAPLLNTLILLSSGATITWAHHVLMNNNKKEASKSLMFTVMLGVLFTALQASEYIEACFSIADSAYGSTFYLATGFHGFHVIIGSVFLLVCLGRMTSNHYSKIHHLSFESAAWYWHFVDVVWLFLYISVYWWGK